MARLAASLFSRLKAESNQKNKKGVNKMKKIFYFIFCICFVLSLAGCNGDGGGGSSGSASPEDGNPPVSPGGDPPVETNNDPSLSGKIFYSVPFMEQGGNTWTKIHKVGSNFETTVVDANASDGGVGGINNRVVYSKKNEGNVFLKTVNGDDLSLISVGAEHAEGIITDPFSVYSDRVLYVAREPGNKETIYCLKLEDGSEIFNFVINELANFSITNPIFSKDGKKVYFGLADFGVLPAQYYIKSFDVEQVPANLAGCETIYSLECPAFQSMSRFSTFGEDKLLFLWDKLYAIDIPTGVATLVFPEPNEWTHGFKLSPDETKMVVWGESVKEYHLEGSQWQLVASAAIESVVNNFFQTVSDVAWSPTENKFVVMVDINTMIDEFNMEKSYKLWIYSSSGGVFLRSLLSEVGASSELAPHPDNIRVVWLP